MGRGIRIDQPTRRQALAHGLQFGPLLGAARQGVGAARVVGAAAGDGVQARHAAVDLVQALVIAVDVGNRGHQPRAVRVGAAVDDRVHRADLGHPAGVHHRHAVAGFGDHAHVVGDQHHRSAALAAQAFEQANDLRLHRHIQRRGGFVGHDQARLGSEGQRNHHALSHAARKLVRVVVESLARGGNAGFLQQGHSAFARLWGADWQMGLDGLHQLLAHAVQRVERGQRVLKNRADVAATQTAQALSVQVVDALAVKPNAATGDAPGWLEQTNDGRAGERLAGTRLAHHAQHLTGGHAEGHTVQSPQHAPAAGELDHQVFDLEQGCGVGQVHARQPIANAG